MLSLVLCLPVTASDRTNTAPKTRPAVLRISGYGLIGDLRLKTMLGILLEEKKKTEFYDAAFIEDAALLLGSRLRDDGYLAPVITARLKLEDGTRAVYVWDQSIEEPLPQGLRAREVRFKIKKGRLYHFSELEFSGLSVIPEKRARAYFIETGGLLSLKQNRRYTPDRFRRGLSNLENDLQRMGFQDATVTTNRLERDDHSGAVKATVLVKEGPKYIVRSVRQEIFFTNSTTPIEIETNAMAQPYSKFWEQDYAQSIKTNHYRHGYPDTSVEFQNIGSHADTNAVLMDMLAVVKTGPRIKVGDVSFVGQQRTKQSVLENRVPLHEGDWLDRIKAERGRYRLSRLGVFESVELKDDPVDDEQRNVIYQLKEGKRIDVSLLFGYGSYELLRGGVQLDQFNVFGRAHHSQLRLIQSVKSSSADYIYTMPEFFGEDLDTFLNASGLRRQEVSFTRVEYGGGAGVRKFYRRIDTDVSVRYNYQILETQDTDVPAAEQGVQNPGVGSIITEVNHDKRDNPLYPHRGYKVFGAFEWATKYLASDVNYQRLDFSASWHRPISDAQWVHLGFSHGFVATVGSTTNDLPFNRRFFPGGENSIRGYQEGEAAPRDSSGKIVGAQTYMLGNVEFEQGLTPKWSVVAFVDAVTFGRTLSHYPGDTTLVSVGGGIRWKTLLGPVRLEYGYNLNPRQRDPTGTILFSLGFPF